MQFVLTAFSLITMQSVDAFEFFIFSMLHYACRFGHGQNKAICRPRKGICERGFLNKIYFWTLLWWCLYFVNAHTKSINTAMSMSLPRSLFVYKNDAKRNATIVLLKRKKIYWIWTELLVRVCNLHSRRLEHKNVWGLFRLFFFVFIHKLDSEAIFKK